MSLQRTVAKNSVYNILGSFAPTLVTIITVPIYISQIGEARYGILALVWLILGYFGLFDLGLGKAVSNQIAFLRKNVDEKQDEKREIFWTAFQINFLLGVIGGLLLYVLGPWLISQFSNRQDQLLNETIKGFSFLAMAVPITTISSVGKGFLEGKEKFALINCLQVLQNIVFQILPLLTAFYIDVSLYFLILAAVIAKIISTVFLFSAIKIYSHIGLITFSRDKVKELITYGGAITVSNIVGPILTSADRFLIGALAGAKAVAYYTIPYNLSVKITSITSSYSRALFPKFSMLNEIESKKLSYDATIFLIIFISPIIILGFLLMDPFLTIWIGEDLSTNSSPLGYIILIGVWINNLAFIPVAYLRGQRRPGIIAIIHSLEILPYLAILWILTNNWGVEGAAFAWSFRVAVDAILMFAYAEINHRLWFYIALTSAIIIGCFLLVYYSIQYHQIILIIFIFCFILYGYYMYKSEYLKLVKSIKSFVRK